MNFKRITLFLALLLSSIAFTSTAQANEPKCKLTTNCPYGSRVSDRWLDGERAEREGDFNRAKVFYSRALNAAEKLNFSGRSKAQVKLLRACAKQGSFSRLQGAIVGSEYMNTHNFTKESVDNALDISRQKFREVSDAQDLQSPELVSKCP